MPITLFGSGQSVIRVSNFTNTTRTIPGGSPSNSSYNILWSVTVTKTTQNSNFIVQGNLPFDGAQAGRGVFFCRINGGTWYTCGNNIYNSFGANCSLVAYLTASSLAAGSYVVDIAWSCSSGSRPFGVWNPNSSDQPNELFYPTQSNLNLYEVVG